MLDRETGKRHVGMQTAIHHISIRCAKSLIIQGVSVFNGNFDELIEQ